MTIKNISENEKKQKMTPVVRSVFSGKEKRKKSPKLNYRYEMELINQHNRKYRYRRNIIITRNTILLG